MRRKIALVFIICLCQIVFSNLAFAKKTKIYTPESEYKHQQNILKLQEKEKYQRSLLPQSGFMTREEYEELSKDIPTSERVVPEYQLPKDIKMKYVPQPTYKLTHYNDPPGSPELRIDRKLKFDRQFVCPGITSPKKDFLVYPVVYYYASNDCTAGDLFIIPFDMSLPEVSRVQRANILKRISEPILSTEKSLREKFIFRTMTPIDFSSDGTKLLAKEKTGNVNDGIWQTDLWVYDFNTKAARKLPEIRDAIRYYWANTENLVLDEKRWDIYPLGFDANDPERVVVSAYGYTGKIPKFLGNWSIDCQGERTLLLSLFDASVPISINGYKIVQFGIVNFTDVYNDEKRQDKIIKQKLKDAKKDKKKEAKQKKEALNKRINEITKERQPKQNSVTKLKVD